MKMSPDDVSVMTPLQQPVPQVDFVVDRTNMINPNWSNTHVVPGLKDELGQHVGQQQHHVVNTDVISMQYMELEEFLLENEVQEGGKVYIDNSQLHGLPDKHYQISLEQRGSHVYNGDAGHTNLPHIHVHNGPNSHMVDPNSPPQSSCDSPPQPDSSSIHSPRSQHNIVNNQGNSHTNTLSNSTARKSLPRRVSTSSNASSNLVVTPPHTPQQPSPPLPPTSTPISSITSEQVKSKRAIKRSRKESVPDESKDDKYWRRRAKNNAAAKRSRDLRREKENHIMQRVTFLEKENKILHQELDSIKMENEELKERLARYESGVGKYL